MNFFKRQIFVTGPRLCIGTAGLYSLLCCKRETINSSYANTSLLSSFVLLNGSAAIGHIGRCYSMYAGCSVYRLRHESRHLRSARYHRRCTLVWPGTSGHLFARNRQCTVLSLLRLSMSHQPARFCRYCTGNQPTSLNSPSHPPPLMSTLDCRRGADIEFARDTNKQHHSNSCVVIPICTWQRGKQRLAGRKGRSGRPSLSYSRRCRYGISVCEASATALLKFSSVDGDYSSGYTWADE